MWKSSLLVFLFTLPCLVLSVKQKAKDLGTSRKSGECISSLHLNSTETLVRKDQRVTLFCLPSWVSHQNNPSSQITQISLFRNKSHLQTQNTTGDPVKFNISISSAGELGPYKCKYKNSNCTKYSNNFHFTMVGDAGCPYCLLLLIPALLLVLGGGALILVFWFLPKHKARNVKKENASRICENEPKEAIIYAKVKTKQAEAESEPEVEPRPCVPVAGEEVAHVQEIEYATPLFPDMTPRRQDEGGCKTDHVYCELKS